MLNKTKKWFCISFTCLSCLNTDFSYCKINFINFKNIYTAKEHLCFLNKTNRDETDEDVFKLSPDLTLPGGKPLKKCSYGNDDPGDMYLHIGELIRAAYVNVFEIPESQKNSEDQKVIDTIINYLKKDDFKNRSGEEKKKLIKSTAKSLLQFVIIELEMIERTKYIIDNTIGCQSEEKDNKMKEIKEIKEIDGEKDFDDRFDKTFEFYQTEIEKAGINSQTANLISGMRENIKNELKFYWTNKRWSISNRILHYCSQKVSNYPSTYDYNDPLREAADYWNNSVTRINDSIYYLYYPLKNKFKINLLKKKEKFNAQNGQNLYESLLSSEKICNDAFKYSTYAARFNEGVGLLDKDDSDEYKRLGALYYVYNRISDENINKAKSVITPAIINSLGVFDLCKTYFTKMQNKQKWGEEDYRNTVNSFVQKIEEKNLLEQEGNLRHDLDFYWNNQCWNMKKWCENFYNAYIENTKELMVGGIKVQPYSFFKDIKDNEKLKKNYKTTWDEKESLEKNQQNLKKEFLDHCVSNDYTELLGYIEAISKSESNEKKKAVDQLKVDQLKIDLNVATKEDFEKHKQHFEKTIDTIIQNPIGCELLRVLLAFYLNDEKSGSVRHLEKLYIISDSIGDVSNNRKGFYFSGRTRYNFYKSASGGGKVPDLEQLVPSISFLQDDLKYITGAKIQKKEDISSPYVDEQNAKNVLSNDACVFHEMVHWLHFISGIFEKKSNSGDFVTYFKRDCMSKNVLDNGGRNGFNKMDYKAMLVSSKNLWDSDEEFFTMFGLCAESDNLDTDMLIGYSDESTGNNIYYSPINEMAYVMRKETTENSIVRLIHTAFKSSNDTYDTTIPWYFLQIIKNVFDESLLAKIYKIATRIEFGETKFR